MSVKTVRLRNARGVVVTTTEENAGRLAGFEPADKVSSDSPYAGLKVDELKAEIAKRNEGRDEADLLSLEGKKPDLVAVLDADDAAQ